MSTEKRIAWGMERAFVDANGQMFFASSKGDYAERCPHGNGIWYDPRQTKDKWDAPYSYSPFFIHGDPKSIEGCGADYTDRYPLWDQDKFKAAIAAVGRSCRWDQMTRAEFQRFVTAYYGEDHTFTGAVEWCNVSNGYPCWSIHFTKGAYQ